MSNVKIIAAVCTTTAATLYDEFGKTHTYSAFEHFEYIQKNIIPQLAKQGFAELDTNAIIGLPTWSKENLAKYFGVKISEETKHFTEMLNSNSETKTQITVGNETIDNADALLPFMEQAMKFGSKKGVQNFLKRLAKINKTRKHTVEDILRFLDKADLPIADDGSIVAYKLLRYYHQGAVTHKTTFVDCHTRKVKQKVGSYVFMKEELVDPDRQQECSAGLHIARRDYLQNFAGDACVLVKVNPEDIIAIPHGDPSKVRTKAYHIVAVLSNTLKDLVIRNKPLDSDPKGKVLLTRVIDGNHVPILEEVEITKDMGKEVINENPSTEEQIEKATKQIEKKKVKKLRSTRNIDDKKKKQKPITKDQVQKVAKSVSPAMQIRNLLTKPITKESAKMLHQYKKLAKKPWSYFGATEDQIKKLDSYK